MDRPKEQGPAGPPEGEIRESLELAEALVEEALLAGAVEAEAYVKTSVTTAIYLGGAPTTFSRGSEGGIALRVFDGTGRFGHSCSSRQGGGRRQELVRAALAALREAGQGPAGSVFPASRPDVGFSVPQGMIDARVTLWSPEEKQAMVESALREASWDPRRGMWATYRDGISRIALANSRGLRAGYARTLSLVTLTRAGFGGPSLHTERISAGPDPKGLTEMAIGRARLQPVGDDAATGGGDLLLESTAAAVLVRQLLPDLQEDSPGGQGPGGVDFQRLASEAVTIVDDGLLPEGVASAPFDGEGNPTGRITLVKAGVRIDRLRSLKPGESGRPGSAVRASYRDLPRPGGTNLCVLPGCRPLASLLAGLGRGLFLEALEGDIREAHSGAGGSRWRGLGWEVRDGELVGACRRFVFAAQPRELLEGILEASDRLTFSLRRGMALGMPDLLIRCRH